MSGACCARRNSAREFHRHGWSVPFKSNVGNLAPRFETKLTSLGKLSSNGPRRPFGYQMKWPMPSDAKSSPSFHAVSPEMVPLHSFCQILFPILRTSVCERVIAEELCGQSAIVNVSLLALPLLGQEKSPQLKDQKDKVSYSIGMNIGANLVKQKVDINPDILAAGIKDMLAGKPQLTPDQVKEVMAQFEKDMEAKQKQAGEKNKTEGAKFLEDNKKKADVKNTASGRHYKVTKEGTGEKPKATDTVSVNYRGTLIDGTEFDSSYKRGQPATFPLNGVIKGWTEGLQLMKTGSKYQLFVPASLAYGERAVSPELGANATLIFEVELLEIKPPATPPPPGSAASQGPQRG